jgi:hypothetical protein
MKKKLIAIVRTEVVRTPDSPATSADRATVRVTRRSMRARTP